MLSQLLFVLKTIVNRAFGLILYTRFLTLLCSASYTCVIFLQMCRPSQTPHLILSLMKLAAGCDPFKGPFRYYGLILETTTAVADDRRCSLTK